MRIFRAGIALCAAAGMLAVFACGQAVSTSAPIQPPASSLVSHRAGTTHAFQPKRLEAVIEIDMGEFYFANPAGEKNPLFTLPAGKTVGIHFHNEGMIVHELMIGRMAKDEAQHGEYHGEYHQLLTKLVPSDLFFYYGQAKVEIEDATFAELEADSGIRDIWIRINVPAELKGEWEIGCFVEGHYEQGMKAKLLVE